MLRKGRFSAADAVEVANSAPGSSNRKLGQDGNMRDRRGKRALSNKNTARNVVRKLKRGSHVTLPPLYMADIPTWNAATRERSTKSCAFLLPHEVAQAIVPQGSEALYTTATEEQQGFARRLQEWGSRVQQDTTVGPWLVVSLWGDSAATSAKSKDSIFFCLGAFLSDQAGLATGVSQSPSGTFAIAGALAVVRSTRRST